MVVSKNECKLIARLEQKKHREEEGLFVAEGPKVVGDLIRHGYRAKRIFIFDNFTNSQFHNLLGTAQLSNCEIVKLSNDELRRISFLRTPQGVLGLFQLPDRQTPPPPCGLTLALDGVQDPGNLGTIIRTADWMGITTIYCSPDTVDAWSPKVVQATMGSIARVNIYYTDLPTLLATSTVPIYGTLLDGKNIYDTPLTPDGIIVMGNEGKGLSPEVRQMVTHRLLIPCYAPNPSDHAESLNVAIATAIVTAEFRKVK